MPWFAYRNAAGRSVNIALSFNTPRPPRIVVTDMATGRFRCATPKDRKDQVFDFEGEVWPYTSTPTTMGSAAKSPPR